MGVGGGVLARAWGMSIVPPPLLGSETDGSGFGVVGRGASTAGCATVLANGSDCGRTLMRSDVRSEAAGGTETGAPQDEQKR